MGVRHSVALVGLILVLGISFSNVGAQGQSRKNYYRIGMVALLQRDLQTAKLNFEKALAIVENFNRKNDQRESIVLARLARVNADLGNNQIAETYARRALEISEANPGRKNLWLARDLSVLAHVYQMSLRFNLAEPFLRKAGEIFKNAFGETYPDYLTVMGTIGIMYRFQNNFDEAEKIYRGILEIIESTSVTDWPKPRFETRQKNRAKKLARTLGQLANILKAKGELKLSENLGRRSLKIYAEEFGPNHIIMASSELSLAETLIAQGRWSLAEVIAKNAFSKIEKNGSKFAQLVMGNQLINIYLSIFKFDEANKLLRKRDNTTTETLLRGKIPQFLKETEFLLGRAQSGLGDTTNSITTLRRAVFAEPKNSRQRVFNAEVFRTIAVAYTQLSMFSEAHKFAERAFKLYLSELGEEHGGTFASMYTLAIAKKNIGEIGASEKFLRAIVSKKNFEFDPGNIFVAGASSSLASLLLKQGRYEEAIKHFRNASSKIKSHNIALIAKPIFAAHVETTAKLAKSNLPQKLLLLEEGFEISQQTRISSINYAISAFAVRQSTGKGEMAALIRRMQDAQVKLNQLNKIWSNILALKPEQRAKNSIQKIKKRFGSKLVEIKRIKLELSNKFPRYFSIIGNRITSINELQGILGPREAVLAYLSLAESTYLWIIRKNIFEIITLNVGQVSLEQHVRQIRLGLSIPRQNNGERLPRFDIQAAHSLYDKIFAPAESLLGNSNHIILVPDGALQSLPFSLLVSEPRDKAKASTNSYQNVQWLIKKYAFTTVPSITSLFALRNYSKHSSAKSSFIGIGNPILNGGKGLNRGIKIASAYAAVGRANSEELKRLPNLPETEVELASMAKFLGHNNSLLLLGRDASERRLKNTDLSTAQIVAFATHGLVAGELGSIAEPGLVLTPPKSPTDIDDGYLAASEIANLKLNADLVILSACNTAASDGRPNATPLSGLAKAFFYAGARALLVSHWPISSTATVNLTTNMIANYRASKNIGWAEALRKSILIFITNSENLDYTHPLIWSPFVIVGDGGPRNNK